MRFSEVGSMDLTSITVRLIRASMRFVFYDFFDSQITITTLTWENPPSKFCIVGQIDRLITFIYVLLENMDMSPSVKLGLCSALRTFEHGGGSKLSLSCHICFDTGPRSHPQHDDILMCVVKGDWKGRTFGWDRKTRGPVSQQVWHDKDLSLLKGPERRA
jgi:hypothetical protein